jgi:hypothetical protein
MKRCPQCRATYTDDIEFCLEDGAILTFSGSMPSQSYSGDTPTVLVSKTQTPTHFQAPQAVAQMRSNSTAIAGILSLFLSFILWLVSWSFWMYELHVAAPASYESRSAIRNVMQGVSAFSVFTEYLAILLVAIALISAAKRLPKD